MNLAWILLLAQMSTPARPKERMIVCWQNQSCINGEGEYVPPPTLPRLRSVACPPHKICKVKPPFDVPGVHRKGGKAVKHTTNQGYWWDCGDYSVPGNIFFHDETTPPQCWPGWTCTDRTRVLLTSEDGKKHCIKFPGE